MASMDTLKVTRLEVLDENGRAYSRRNVKIELHLQDDNRTLKVFVEPRSNKESQS